MKTAGLLGKGTETVTVLSPSLNQKKECEEGLQKEVQRRLLSGNNLTQFLSSQPPVKTEKEYRGKIVEGGGKPTCGISNMKDLLFYIKSNNQMSSPRESNPDYH